MGNICDNYLRVSGTEEQVTELTAKISAQFGDRLYDENSIENGSSLFCELWISSDFRFPGEVFKQITDSLTSTEGLHIRVASDEPAMNYLEQSIFENGKWDFVDFLNINTRIHALTLQGLNQIRELVRAKGTITFDEDCHWSALYVNDDGYGELAYFQRIELEENGKISVQLSDSFWLYEDDLTTTHIIDILTLINEEHERHTQ